MSKDPSILKCSYVLKRLRDSGYTAEKVVGPTNVKSLESEFIQQIKKVFPEGKTYHQKEISKSLFFLQDNLAKFFHRPPSYSDDDSRVWTILVDGGNTSIFLTLFLNAKDSEDLYEDYGENWIEINDGNQYIKPFRRKVSSLSFEVLAEELTKYGIIGRVDSTPDNDN